MKKYLFMCLFMCVACTAGHKIMTFDAFSDIEEGINEKELKEMAGTPYSIKNLGNGIKEYEYIERIIIDDRVIEMNHYIFIIKDGIVTSKKVIKGENFKPFLDRNAYDLQTSYNDNQ